jgi:hypothetical protein
MPSLRGIADEAELVPPWASVFGRDHLRVVRVGLVSSRRSASVRGGLARCPKVTAK